MRRALRGRGAATRPPQSRRLFSIHAQERLAAFHSYLMAETELGNLSRQEEVSMVPPCCMDVRPGMAVLDMCIAKLGKSRPGPCLEAGGATTVARSASSAYRPKPLKRLSCARGTESPNAQPPRQARTASLCRTPRCAAPGSKTGQLLEALDASLMHLPAESADGDGAAAAASGAAQKGFVIANDTDYKRRRGRPQAASFGVVAELLGPPLALGCSAALPRRRGVLCLAPCRGRHHGWEAAAK